MEALTQDIVSVETKNIEEAVSTQLSTESTVREDEEGSMTLIYHDEQKQATEKTTTKKKEKKLTPTTQYFDIKKDDIV